MEQMVEIKLQALREYIRSHFPYGGRGSRQQEAAEVLLNTTRVATFHEQCKGNAIIVRPLKTLEELAAKWRLTDIEKFIYHLTTFPEREKFILGGYSNRGRA